MQTFLPYPDFQASAECLDVKRLGKQRVEALTIWRTIIYENNDGWINHPAVKMWWGFSNCLALYHNIIIDEWERRGYKNNMKHIIHPPVRNPPWLGDEDFHASHRSNLLRKDPEWYGQFGWTEPDDLPYVWPKVEENVS